MNLVLLEPGEAGRELPVSDARIRHVTQVLRRKPGEAFDAAIVGQSKGKAWIHSITERGGVLLEYQALESAPPPEPGVLLCGLCRPQTVRRIVRDCATMGIGMLHFFPAGRSEPSYAEASLWTDGELDRLLREAAQQAFTCRLASVQVHPNATEAFAALPNPTDAPRLALDNYEADQRLGTALPNAGEWVLAVGPERGWDSKDREHLRTEGFRLCSLGSRVLRTETACVAALTLARAALGRI